MIKRNRASIPKLIIHKIGNKFNDTRNVFSESPELFDPIIPGKTYMEELEKFNIEKFELLGSTGKSNLFK